MKLTSFYTLFVHYIENVQTLHVMGNWMGTLSFLGAVGVIFTFISFFDEIHVSKQNSPRWDAAFCLPSVP